MVKPENLTMRQKLNSKEEKKYENKKNDLINLNVSGSIWYDRMQ